MESVTIRIMGLISLLFSSVACAGFSDIDDWGIKPNLGIDAGVKGQPFDEAFGREHFRMHYPITNVYFGAKFHPLVGIEMGYEYMYRAQMRQFYNSGAPVLGFINPLVTDQRFHISDAYARGWNVNLLGFWPICPRTKTELMGSLGIAWLKMYYNTAAVLDGNPATPLAMWESDTRALFKVGLGVRQMITKHFGSRLQVFWEDTSKLDATFAVPTGQGGVAQPIVPANNYTVSPKDGYSVLLGFFFQIT